LLQEVEGSGGEFAAGEREKERLWKKGLDRLIKETPEEDVAGGRRVSSRRKGKRWRKRKFFLAGSVHGRRQGRRTGGVLSARGGKSPADSSMHQKRGERRGTCYYIEKPNQLRF